LLVHPSACPHRLFYTICRQTDNTALSTMCELPPTCLKHPSSHDASCRASSGVQHSSKTSNTEASTFIQTSQQRRTPNEPDNESVELRHSSRRRLANQSAKGGDLHEARVDFLRCVRPFMRLSATLGSITDTLNYNCGLRLC
jgi:hypothetical protein